MEREPPRFWWESGEREPKNNINAQQKPGYHGDKASKVGLDVLFPSKVGKQSRKKKVMKSKFFSPREA